MSSTKQIKTRGRNLFVNGAPFFRSCYKGTPPAGAKQTTRPSHEYEIEAACAAPNGEVLSLSNGTLHAWSAAGKHLRIEPVDLPYPREKRVTGISVTSGVLAILWCWQHSKQRHVTLCKMVCGRWKPFHSEITYPLWGKCQLEPGDGGFILSGPHVNLRPPAHISTKTIRIP